MSSSLPDGFHVRPATVDDAPAIDELIRAADEAVQDRSDAGFVGAIGVLKPWRKREIGLALLHHAFVEFYRLYERAGMHVAYEAVTYGRDLE